MKILQWNMTIPAGKRVGFEKWFAAESRPTMAGLGVIRHELHRVGEKAEVGRQKTENGRYMERIYLAEGVEPAEFFAKAKADAKAWAVSRKYETEFGAGDIELRVLEEV